MKDLKIVSKLAEGGNSTVYLAKDENNKRYALKVSANKKLLRHEAMIYGKVKSPSLATFTEFYEKDDSAVLVTEYIDGDSLLNVVERRNGLTFGNAVRIALEVAECIDCFHKSNPPLVFRDIKPENIMVAQDGSIRIIDPGSCISEGEDNSLSVSNGFSAPEQYEGGRLTPAADVYALAKLLFYMLAYSTDESMVIYLQGGSRGVQYLLMDCLNKDPSKRPPGMDEFVRRLSPYRNAEGFRFLKAEIVARKYRRKHSQEEYVSSVEIMN